MRSCKIFDSLRETFCTSYGIRTVRARSCSHCARMAASFAICRCRKRAGTVTPISKAISNSDHRRSEQSSARIFESAEPFGLKPDGAIQLSSEPERDEQTGNRNPLQAPGGSFTCGHPGPESETSQKHVWNKGDDGLDQENQDHERTADGQELTRDRRMEVRGLVWEAAHRRRAHHTVYNHCSMRRGI